MSKFIIDPLHSDIEFSVKHLMISTVRGRFADFTAEMSAESEDFSDLKAEFTANVSSISTGVADRDAHLRTPDFFDVEKFPTLKFKTTKIEKLDSGYKVHGEMTIRDITMPLILDGVYNGSDVDLYGNTKYGFEATGKLLRSDYGLTFNALSGGGNALVGNEIKLTIGVQFTKV